MGWVIEKRRRHSAEVVEEIPAGDSFWDACDAAELLEKDDRISLFTIRREED